MDFEAPGYPLETVDRAGDALIGYEDAVDWFRRQEYSHIDVIDNWRAAHYYPTNTFQMALRRRAIKVDPGALIAQRSKRLHSIDVKLRKHGALKLTKMQDVGGCRAIVETIDQLKALIGQYKAGYSKHTLVDRSNYVDNPKDDGYRGYHFVYAYDETDPRWKNLRVEVQLRTQRMHWWATAVETVDVFLREGLKQHKGSPEWRRFFALMSTVIARSEGCRQIRFTSANAQELVDELRDLDGRLFGVTSRLRAFRQTLAMAQDETIKRERIRLILLSLRIDGSTQKPILSWFGFRQNQRSQADDVVSQEEAKGNDAVLVAVSDATRLRQAYPNYFLDTDQFCDFVESTIE